MASKLQSKIETTIREQLPNLHIVQDYRPDWLAFKPNMPPYEIDIAIFAKNGDAYPILAIEVQGPTHSKMKSQYNHDIKLTSIRDRFKRDRCNKLEIPLIEIDYKEFKKVTLSGLIGWHIRYPNTQIQLDKLLKIHECLRGERPSALELSSIKKYQQPFKIRRRPLYITVDDLCKPIAQIDDKPSRNSDNRKFGNVGKPPSKKEKPNSKKDRFLNKFEGGHRNAIKFSAEIEERRKMLGLN